MEARPVQILLTISCLILSAYAQAGTAERVHTAALRALDPQNLRIDTKPATLYGHPINTEELAYGFLACARVASAVLDHAGVRIPRLNKNGRETSELAMAVYEVEHRLEKLRWTKITEPNDLRPGDVIVWRSKSNQNANYACSGEGNCHVGIITSRGAFNNDIQQIFPAFTPIDIGPDFPFKVGYHAPN